MSDSRRTTYKHDKLYSTLQYLAKGDMCFSRIDICPWKSFHVQQPIMINVSHHPAATTRIAADGNCFYRRMSLVVTGSQAFHQELRLRITTHAHIQILRFNSLASSDGSTEQYMKRSRMQSLGVWATEVEIIAAASLLNATIYVYAQCGDYSFKCMAETLSR